jgi:hypothetical protein
VATYRATKAREGQDFNVDARVRESDTRAPYLTNRFDKLWRGTNRLVCCVLVVATFFLPGAATALDVNRAPFRTLSEGATTCGEFIAEPWMQSARMEWVLGYISGRNREGSSPDERNIGSSFQEPATVIAWLQNYCQVHSLDRLLNAADHLRADFQRHEGH